MSAFDAVSYAVGEAVGYIVGKVVGTAFNIKPKEAQRIGELMVLLTMVGAIIIITVMYS